METVGGYRVVRWHGPVVLPRERGTMHQTTGQTGQAHPGARWRHLAATGRLLPLDVFHRLCKRLWITERFTGKKGSREMTETPTDNDNRPTLAGNWVDDDWDVIDDLVESQANPPEPDDLPVVRLSVTRATIPTLTRTITSTYNQTVEQGPIMAMNPDARRKSLKIHVFGTTDLYLSDDRATLTGMQSNAFRLSAPGEYDILEHTGAVWIAGDLTEAGTAPVNFSILAVTE